MANGVLVFAEVRDGQLKAINRELVAAARLLGEAGAGDVSVAVVGDGSSNAAEEAARLGATRVYVATAGELAAYSTQGYTTALEAIVRESGAKIVIFGATAMGRDLSARLAARMNACLLADCTEVSLTDGALSAKRPVYSGKVYMELVATSEVQMATIRSNIFPPVEPTDSACERVDVAVSIDAASITGRVTQFVGTGAGKKDLTEAEIVVAGGRALKSGENFGMLEELAGEGSLSFR